MAELKHSQPDQLRMYRGLTLDKKELKEERLRCENGLPLREINLMSCKFMATQETRSGLLSKYLVLVLLD